MMQLRRTEFMGDKLSTNVHNQAGSTECITKLTKSIIYNIYYERKLIPDKYFVTRLIEGIPVKEFIPETDNRRILKLNEWIQDLTRSIENKTLKSVCLELITLDTNKLIECYNIKYSYRDETSSKNISEQSTANSIQATLKNMKNILKNKLNPIVDKRNLRFRLTADTTGFGKDSSVFSNGKKRMMQFSIDDGVDMEMGTVCTPFHRLILKVTAELKQNPEEDTENDVIIIEENSQLSMAEVIEVMDDDSASVHSLNQAEKMDTESSRLYSTILEISNLKMSCICDTEIRNQIFTIIQCKNCSTYQHAECYGIRKIADIPGRHLCHDCSCLLYDSFLKVRSPLTGEIISQENDAHTDARLVEYTINELKEIGRIRLILIYMCREKRLPLDFLKLNFSPQDFDRLFTKLIDYKILLPKDEDKFSLNSVQVNLFLKRHFKSKYSINKYF